MNTEFIVDFPILHKKKLIYLDSAATSQKPQVVIDAVSDFYTNHCANVYRAVYDLAEQATLRYSASRAAVAEFINCKFNEVVFTQSTTAAINFVATSWGGQFLRAGDEIILSIAEHHSNLVAWQALAKTKGLTLKFIKLDQNYDLDFSHYQTLLSPKTKLVALTQASNVLGVTYDLQNFIHLAKDFGAAVLVDAAQSAPYRPLNLQNLNCDFLVFSGHKMLAPDGIGVLYLNERWHDQLEPYQFGGGMVSSVTQFEAKYLAAPQKFEAGTMPIAAAIGLHAALDYYRSKISWSFLQQHLAELCRLFIAGADEIPNLKIIGNRQALSHAGHLVSFTLAGWHAHDVAAYLARFGICVRAGHHCAQPLHQYFGLKATVRVSFHIYNTVAEVAILLKHLQELAEQKI